MPVGDQNVRVRPARIDDGERIWPLTQQLASSFEPTRAAFDAGIAAVLEADDVLLAVAEAGSGDLVGYVLASTHVALFANGPVGWVEELIVAPEARRSGVGRLLMRAAEQWAGERGAAYLALATRRATDFYGALGYEESATFLRKMLA